MLRQRVPGVQRSEVSDVRASVPHLPRVCVEMARDASSRLRRPAETRWRAELKCVGPGVTLSCFHVIPWSCLTRLREPDLQLSWGMRSVTEYAEVPSNNRGFPLESREGPSSVHAPGVFVGPWVYGRLHELESESRAL